MSAPRATRGRVGVAGGGAVVVGVAVRLANKRIIVTGAATGIGRATARLAAADGAQAEARYVRGTLFTN